MRLVQHQESRKNALQVQLAQVCTLQGHYSGSLRCPSALRVTATAARSAYQLMSAFPDRAQVALLRDRLPAAEVEYAIEDALLQAGHAGGVLKPYAGA